MDRLAETLADALVEAVGMRREPPLDVFSLARGAGVDQIDYEGFAGDGKIEIAPSFVRVVLKSRASKAQQRFALAHELGHLVLDDVEVVTQVQRLDPHVDEEWLCNRFAAELLMPRRWIASAYRPRSRDFDTLVDVARTAQVSMSAAFVQLTRSGGWGSSLLYFDRTRDWKLSVLAGTRTRTSGSIVARDETRRRFESAYRRDVIGERATLELMVNGRKVSVESELKAADSGVLVIAPLHTLN
jgi:hypothetical protein